MKIDEKLQYDINREAAKISSLSSRKIDHYEHLTGNKIFPYGQSQMNKHSKLTNNLLQKTFKEQTKIIED